MNLGVLFCFFNDEEIVCFFVGYGSEMIYLIRKFNWIIIVKMENCEFLFLCYVLSMNFGL